MKIDLDPEGPRTAIELWRKAVDMEIPLTPGLRSHFLARRGELLSGFVKVASNWLMLLRDCNADGDDLVALNALMSEIEAFKLWADGGLDEITKLAKE
jgi:hypothetical protein